MYLCYPKSGLASENQPQCISGSLAEMTYKKRSGIMLIHLFTYKLNFLKSLLLVLANIYSF